VGGGLGQGVTRKENSASGGRGEKAKKNRKSPVRHTMQDREGTKKKEKTATCKKKQKKKKLGD